jgi:peptidoglycan/LPS O-acetylase OafA/YrhL
LVTNCIFATLTSKPSLFQLYSVNKNPSLPVAVAVEHPKESTQVINYSPQLDGLRFIAVLSVVCYHWLPFIRKWETSYFFGSFVNFFFVLSSYLITRILFSAREKGIKSGISGFRVIYIFILRRTIRIFPAYYFFLLVVILLPVIGNDVKNHAAMYYSYLANYQIFLNQKWPSVTSHIWTLALEEQFYLIWPFIIIFVPHKHLLKVFLLVIIGSVVLRAIFYYPTAGIPQVILTQYCLDPFAIGGLLTYKYTASDSEKQTINKYFNSILYVAVPLAVLIIVMKSYYFSFVINGLIFSMIAFKIIDIAAVGFKGWFGSFLENKIVVFIGRISYGIYLYHLLVPIIFWKVFSIIYNHLLHHFPAFFTTNHKEIAAFIKLMASDPVCFVIYSVCVIVLALISANLIEKPFSSLKRFLSFEKSPANIKV